MERSGGRVRQGVRGVRRGERALQSRMAQSDHQLEDHACRVCHQQGPTRRRWRKVHSTPVKTPKMIKIPEKNCKQTYVFKHFRFVLIERFGQTQVNSTWGTGIYTRRSSTTWPRVQSDMDIVASLRQRSWSGPLASTCLYCNFMANVLGNIKYRYMFFLPLIGLQDSIFFHSSFSTLIQRNLLQHN